MPDTQLNNKSPTTSDEGSIFTLPNVLPAQRSERCQKDLQLLFRQLSVLIPYFIRV